MSQSDNVLNKFIDNISFLMQHSPYAIWFKNKNLQYTGGNDYFYMLAGLKEPDVLLQHDENLPWACFANEYKSVDEKVLLGGHEKVFNLVRKKDKQYISMVTQKSPIINTSTVSI